MNEEQRKALARQIEAYWRRQDWSDDPEMATSEYYGGPYRGGTTVSPLMEVALYGMSDPNAGLLSYDPTHISIQKTPPPKRMGTRYGLDSARAYREIDAHPNRSGNTTQAHYMPYWNEVRLLHPNLINYHVADDPRAKSSQYRVKKVRPEDEWEGVAAHELRHAGLNYLQQNPSLIPFAGYGIPGGISYRETARGLLLDDPKGEHKLIGAMSTDWYDRRYEGQTDANIATTPDERKGRQKIMEALNKSIADTKILR
jgi:hypothetical protein